MTIYIDLTTRPERKIKVEIAQNKLKPEADKI